MTPRLTVALGAAAVALLVVPPARGYVRTTSRDGHALHWGRHDLQATLYAGGGPAYLPRATLVHAVRAAADTWGAGAVSCTDMRVQVDESNDATGPLEADGVNRLVFVEDWPYAADVLALTTVSSRGGTIFDADIELNGRLSWADVVAEGGRDHHDVQNVLTHEFGHFLGFDHSCWENDPTRSRPNDNTGQPIPDCRDASAALQQSTMYPSALPGDVSKRDLTKDDIQGMCDVYPVDTGGCALGGRAPAGGWALLAVGLFVLRRRRRG